jgi:hypothetical protein
MPSKRIPLGGTYNTRPETQRLSGSSGVVGVGIVGVMIVGAANSGTGKDHRKINCLNITEADETTNSKRLYLVKRPGLAASITPSAGENGSAIHVWAGQGSGQKVMSCFDNETDSTLFDSTTSKGDITGIAKHITETSVSGTATLTITSSDSTLWYYQDGGSATKVTDGDYPGNGGRTMTGPLSHLDGFGFQMDSTGRIYNSDLNSVTAWTAAAFITANSVPDVGVAAWRHRNVILGFCKEHIDVFRNAGNATGSPLSRIDEMSLKIGCISEHAIVDVRDTVYFAGSTKGSHVGIYAYNGGQIQKVSVPEIETQLVIAGASNISMTALGFYGRHHLWINASSATFGYCIEEKQWYEVSGVYRIWYKAAGVAAGSALVNYVISNESTSGKVYVMNPSSIVYQDDGVTYAAMFQTAVVDFGTRLRKRFDRVTYIGDQQATATDLSLAHTDDDYQTISTARSFDLSSSTPFLTRCGTARRRAWVLSHSGNSAMRAEALDFDFEVQER